MGWLPEDWKRIIISIEKLTVDGEKQNYSPVGTAFLIDYDQFTMLVTCQHILEKAKLDQLFLSFNTRNHQIYRIPFSQLSNEFVEWITDKNPEIDVAVIPICLDPNKLDVKKLLSKMFASYDELFEGDEIFFLGFPLGIRYTNEIHPLVRQGIIAYKHKSGPFLIDAQVYPGNSGSPVFLKPSAIEFDSKGNATIGKIKPPKLVGMITSYLPYVDVCVSLQTNKPRITFEENSGLANVIPLDSILNIFKSDSFQEMISKLKSKIENNKKKDS